MRLFGWSKKFYFLKIEIRWPKKKAFDHENHFTLLFSLQSISGKWERERARARSRSPLRADRDLAGKHSSRRWSQSRHREIAPLITISPSRDRNRRRDLAKRRSRDLVYRRERKIRDRDRRFARSRRRSRSRKDRGLTFARSRRQSRSRLRDLAFARSRRRSQSTARSSDWICRRWWFFFWVVACVFLDLCFPSSFPNTRKYFPEIFLKCNQTPWKHFPFPEISISGKYVFSGKCFTATKHNLKSLPSPN